MEKSSQSQALNRCLRQKGSPVGKVQKPCVGSGVGGREGKMARLRLVGGTGPAPKQQGARKHCLQAQTKKRPDSLCLTVELLRLLSQLQRPN